MVKCIWTASTSLPCRCFSLVYGAFHLNQNWEDGNGNYVTFQQDAFKFQAGKLWSGKF